MTRLTRQLKEIACRFNLLMVAISFAEAGEYDAAIGFAEKGRCVSETVKQARKKFAVQLSTGARDLGKIKSAIMFATLAQCSGCDAVVFCVQDGADALIKGEIKEEGLPPGVSSFEERLHDALKVGVKFQLCEQVAVNRGLSSKDLIEGVSIVDGSNLIAYALEYDGMLYF
ncbi:MAG: DsrE family protein [Nitrospirae bacterium]|nr:DsrE family protein [Nitrospirota bacterium]